MKQSTNSLLTITQAAKFLQVSPKTLRRWEDHGLIIPTRTPQNHRRYAKSELIDLKNRKHQPLPKSPKVSTTPRPTYSISEAAEYLQVSIKTIRRWDKSGKICSTRNPQNQRVFTQEELYKAKTSQLKQTITQSNPHTIPQIPQPSAPISPMRPSNPLFHPAPIASLIITTGIIIASIGLSTRTQPTNVAQMPSSTQESPSFQIDITPPQNQTHTLANTNTDIELNSPLSPSELHVLLLDNQSDPDDINNLGNQFRNTFNDKPITLTPIHQVFQTIIPVASSIDKDLTILLTSPSGRQISHIAKKTDSGWLMRFIPDEIGVWTASWTSTSPESITFQVTNSLE